MKTKKIKKKMALNKSTIVNLDRAAMKKAQGGGETVSICGSDTYCDSLPNTFVCPTGTGVCTITLPTCKC